MINREALLEKVQYRIAPNSYDSMIIGRCVDITRKLIEDAPAVDAVEVCRCKDCKHWREETLWCDMNSIDRGEHYTWYAEDFCSYGERKEN